MRFLTGAAVAAGMLCAAVAPASAQMKPEERSQLRSEIRAYLLEHPEVLMEAMAILDERRRAEEAAAALKLVADNADEIFNDGYSFVGGNPDGDITVVEFLDYNCGYCKRAHDGVKTLLEMDGGVRFVVKEFPILGPTSQLAAQAAMAAMKQDDGARYLEFSDRLMTSRGQLTDDQIWSIAADSGLDVDRLQADAASDDVAAAIQRTYALARKLQISGTPTFVIGDELIRGFIPLEAMIESVAEARRKAG